MIEIIEIPKETSFLETVLDGFLIRFDFYYVKRIDRFVMDIENKTNGEKAFGITMNTGIDLLTASGRLGLQVLALVSIPKPNLEGGLLNFATDTKLVYMDLNTYDNAALKGGVSRMQWPSE